MIKSRSGVIIAHNCTNTVVQRTAHLITMLYSYKLTKLMWERNIPYRWIIADMHDDVLPSIPASQIEAFSQCVRDARDWVNIDILRAEVKHKIEPDFGSNLAALKCESYEDEELHELLGSL